LFQGQQAVADFEGERGSYPEHNADPDTKGRDKPNLSVAAASVHKGAPVLEDRINIPERVNRNERRVEEKLRQLLPAEGGDMMTPNQIGYFYLFY
jgi:hypothetical protein